MGWQLAHAVGCDLLVSFLVVGMDGAVGDLGSGTICPQMKTANHHTQNTHDTDYHIRQRHLWYLQCPSPHADQSMTLPVPRCRFTTHWFVLTRLATGLSGWTLQSCMACPARCGVHCAALAMALSPPLLCCACLEMCSEAYLARFDTLYAPENLELNRFGTKKG